jgi:hypothetical protein
VRVTLDLDDPELLDRVLTSAIAERRPVPWHVEVLLRRAVGLPFPVPARETLPVEGASNVHD